MLITRTIMLVLGCSIAAAGCASSYFDQYQSAHPEWNFVFPDPDANLEQTIASLYAPPPIGTQLLVRKLAILQVHVIPWSTRSLADLQSGEFQSSSNESYAVIANFICESRVDLQYYRGEKIAFYLLPGNRLSSYDHYQFIEGCTVYNDFRPATGELISVERAVQEYITEHYPQSMIHVSELFEKGIAYARAGRLDDAKKMLRAGASNMDVSGDSERPEFETPGIQIRLADRDHAQTARYRLIEAIAAAEDR